ncbi:hypothetical protein CPB86DRAFT_783521 [Serendipita vermifera]|nr:hypothetical protein CPB86DRAFT_783521 [Serendipita vermifera]
MNTSDPSPTDPNNGRSSDGRIQVERVLIDAWHPVLDENGDSRDYRLELELYTRSHSRPNPCTIRLGHYDSLRLRFELKFKDINPKKANVTLSILEFKTDFKETNSSNILSETIGFEAMPEGSSILVAFLQEPSKLVPWGFQGKITWQFEAYVKGEQPIKFTLTHHFELYAISESVTAKRANMLFQRKGIPRKALELYILVSKSLATHPVKTFQQYIAAIANVVHSHTGHIYDVWNGSPFYTSGGSGDPDIIFNINRWANHMVIGKVPKGKESLAPMVNCFDQTAAMWIGICLGLVDKDAAKLVWYWAKPFGFINPTHLVGWDGLANNAYFDGVSSMMLTHDALSSDRWGYWTHVFLAFDEMAIDATCGPVIGVPLAEYLENAIDREAGKATKNGAWENNIKTQQERQIVVESGGATTKTIAAVKDGVYDLDSQFWLDKPLREEMPPPKPSETSKRLTILPEDYDKLLADVVTIMEERDYDHDSRNNKQKHKKKPSGDNITHIYWRVVRDPVGSILINVYILESEEAAEKYFSALSTKSELPTSDILVPWEDQPNHLVGKKSGSGRRLWQSLNIVVSMAGLSSSEELQKFVYVVNRHLKPADPDSRRRVNIRSVTIEGAGDHPHYTCNVGAVIRVTVTAEYGYGFELGACAHGCLFALWVDKPKVDSTGPQIQGRATFHFLARMKGDEEFMLRVYDSDFGRYKSQLTEVIKLKIVGK